MNGELSGEKGAKGQMSILSQLFDHEKTFNQTTSEQLGHIQEKIVTILGIIDTFSGNESPDENKKTSEDIPYQDDRIKAGSNIETYVKDMIELHQTVITKMRGTKRQLNQLLEAIERLL